MPGGAAAKNQFTQYRGPRLDPWSVNYISHAAAERSYATTKDPACCREDQRSDMQQLRPGSGKRKNKQVIYVYILKACFIKRKTKAKTGERVISQH